MRAQSACGSGDVAKSRGAHAEHGGPLGFAWQQGRRGRRGSAAREPRQSFDRSGASRRRSARAADRRVGATDSRCSSWMTSRRRANGPGLSSSPVGPARDRWRSVKRSSRPASATHPSEGGRPSLSDLFGHGPPKNRLNESASRSRSSRDVGVEPVTLRVSGAPPPSDHHQALGRRVADPVEGECAHRGSRSVRRDARRGRAGRRPRPGAGRGCGWDRWPGRRAGSAHGSRNRGARHGWPARAVQRPASRGRARVAGLGDDAHEAQPPARSWSSRQRVLRWSTWSESSRAGSTLMSRRERLTRAPPRGAGR